MLFATTIFAVFLHISVAERSSLLRAHEYPETQIYADYRQIDGIPLVYARCNSSQPKLGRQCIVTMQFDAFEKTAGETKECQVNLKPELTYGKINKQYRIYAFGRDKILLLWTETQSGSNSEDDMEWTILKATVVHMFDGCRTFEASVRKDMWHSLACFGKSEINVITFNKTFEMRLGKLNKDCQIEQFCDVVEYRLLKFDDQARRIGEAEHWPMPPFNGTFQSSSIESMKFDRSEKGYFVANEDFSRLLVQRINKTSSGYHQLTIWENSPNASYRTFRWSLANKAIGFCHVYGDEYAIFGCWKSDQKGHIHTQMNFTMKTPALTQLSAVYNLRNGKLLLAVPKCTKSDCYVSGHSKYYENYYLMEVDGKSNVNLVHVHFKSKCHSEDNTVSIMLFENKQDQYCIVRLCQSTKLRKLVKSRSESSVLCYSSDEFSKCTNCL